MNNLETAITILPILVLIIGGIIVIHKIDKIEQETLKKVLQIKIDELKKENK